MEKKRTLHIPVAVATMLILVFSIASTALAGGGHYDHHKPAPELTVVTPECVLGPKGQRESYIWVAAPYDTHGRKMILKMDLTIDTAYRGTKTIWSETKVEGYGTVVETQYAGPGTHHIYGEVKLFDHKKKVKVSVDTYVDCGQPLFANPKARILQPCGDPMGGALYNNRHSTRAVTYIFEGAPKKSGPWSEIHRRTVQGGDVFVTRAFYLEPGSWVRVRRGNGEVLLDNQGNPVIEQVAEAGFYGWNSWECRVLQNRGYLR